MQGKLILIRLHSTFIFQVANSTSQLQWESMCVVTLCQWFGPFTRAILAADLLCEVHAALGGKFHGKLSTIFIDLLEILNGDICKPCACIEREKGSPYIHLVKSVQSYCAPLHCYILSAFLPCLIQSMFDTTWHSNTNRKYSKGVQKSEPKHP